ncbi:MAG: selenocysteine-specific translation elongation factor [Thermodesulfovibrionales bacterium]|nr:selenocysteine-specific translation elongation factor [Thermodesulfovibrionales bacterium]
MRYVILGTAGHIDHGKSAIVKALTGIDPDRLKEEKERGITIDLGFADLEYPDGLMVGIVDVPGHERLVRNMLAGAGGIDIVLLVIAADEGIMPQTREHLHICKLLDIKTGLVAVTKADLAEPDWIELVSEEAREFVKGSFLEGADIVPVSSKTGQNMDVLKEKIKEAALRVKPKPSDGLFRLPIDRVFTLKGFGTVVTGTAVSGSVSIDDVVEILPRSLMSKVRGLHSHGSPVKTAYAGQRVAVNLQAVEKEDLRRGDTLVQPDKFLPTTAIDGRLQLLNDAPPVKGRALFHFHTGTSETIARCILYDRDELLPGETCYCQMRLQEPVTVQSGDRYIIRRFSPVETVGGGEVLDPSPSRRRKKEGLDDLKIFEHGQLPEKIGVKIKKAGLRGMPEETVQGWIKAEVPAISDAIRLLKNKCELIQVEDILIHREPLDSFKKAVVKMLQRFHKENPLKHGMPKEEIRTALRLPQKTFAGLISKLNEVRTEKETARLESFRAELSAEDMARILGLLSKGRFQPPAKPEISAGLSMAEKQVADILGNMQKQGSVVRINDSVFLSRPVYEEMLNLLWGFFSKKPEMSVSEFRDLLGTTRKYAVPFLEYLDSNNITLRVGDIRKFLLKGGTASSAPTT